MRVRRRQRRERKGAGVLGGKTSTVSYSEERQQRLQWLSLSLTRRSGQQRSGPPSVPDAGSRQLRRYIERCIGHVISAADRGSSDGWQPHWRGTKGGAINVTVRAGIVPFLHQRLGRPSMASAAAQKRQCQRRRCQMKLCQRWRCQRKWQLSYPP